MQGRWPQSMEELISLLPQEAPRHATLWLALLWLVTLIFVYRTYVMLHDPVLQVPPALDRTIARCVSWIAL